MIESKTHPADRLKEAAQAVYATCFTAAPITFEEAARRGTLHYHRATEAARLAVQALGQRKG